MTKKKNPEDLKKVGRKSILETNLVAVGKLESALAIGATVSLACVHAEISRDTYYEYLKKHPEKADKYKQLQKKPILKALNTIVADLDDPKTAKWYLEKKLPSEFGNIFDVGMTIKEKPDLSMLSPSAIKALADEAINQLKQ